MDNEVDPRIPGTATIWQLWHIDTFDPDSVPTLQAGGEDIFQGLYELWFYTLGEGIQDGGSASFSGFYLTWGNTPSTRVDINVKPFDNVSLVKLRQWAHLTSPPEEGEGRPAAPDRGEQRAAILMRVAQLHYKLLQKSSRWKETAIDWSAESRELLARVELMTDPDEL
jgi:hypothetical protein